MTRFKLRIKRLGDHIHVALFVSPPGQETYAKTGDLVFRLGEYQVFAAALYAAAWPPGTLRIDEEGDALEAPDGAS